jgi:hypothetical protein
MSHSSGSHDARYRKTDERIISALVRLLDRKSFDDITVEIFRANQAFTAPLFISISPTRKQWSQQCSETSSVKSIN